MPVPRFFYSWNILFILLLASASGPLFAATAEQQASPDFTEISRYARYANAAYQGTEQVRELGQADHYRLDHAGTVAEQEIGYFLLTNDANRSQLIAVRGTANVENALVDVALKLVPDKHSGIRLHNGFSQAAEKIYQQIRPLLKTDYKISTTGHSLGGAVALVLAMYLDVDGFKVDQVVTFGQPKVTNVTGAAKFEHLALTRVVTPRDLVPLVPPLDPLDINDLDIYWHAGKEILLLEDKDYALLEGINSMLRATRFTQQPLSESNLQHHRMALYLQLLDKKTTGARQVPFKTSLNLFNLFGGEQQ